MKCFLASDELHDGAIGLIALGNLAAVLNATVSELLVPKNDQSKVHQVH